MFEFTRKLKTITIVLMLIGAISVGFSFFGGYHSDAAHEEHGEHTEQAGENHATARHQEEELPKYDYHKTSSQAFPENNSHYQVEQMEPEHDAEHIQHQLENKPWANLTVNNFFFLAVSLGALFFLAVQYAAQVSWSVLVFRVMEAMAQYIFIPMIIMLVIVLAGLYGHTNHMWHWMQEGLMIKDSGNYDVVIAGKEFYLNKPFFLLRTILYAIIWIGGAIILRRLSLKMDNDSANSVVLYKRLRTLSIIFLVLYGFSSVTSAWDWIMSIDTHWFSTMFGWYTFAGTFISALTVLTLLVIFLKDRGYLEYVNHSHIHDLAKFMFAFSIFWTYLWFAQYMLQWYSQQPEEVTYFMIRFSGAYQGLFLTMLTLNFVFPILILMSRDTKRNKGFIIAAGIFMIIGHWLDFYIMIMPGTIGTNWTIGFIEIGTFLGFAGLFLFVVFTAMTKASFVPKNNPLLQESKYFHI